VTEHNILVVAKYYSRIRMERLAMLLDLPAAEAEKHLSDMVVAGHVTAKIDRPAGAYTVLPCCFTLIRAVHPVTVIVLRMELGVKELECGERWRMADMLLWVCRRGAILSTPWCRRHPERLGWQHLEAADQSGEGDAADQQGVDGTPGANRWGVMIADCYVWDNTCCSPLFP
jgi:PCI domain